MAHVIYDKATNAPLMIVLNPTDVHIASLQRQCQDDLSKGLHVVNDDVYQSFTKPEDVVSSIVTAVAIDLSSAVSSD